MLSLAAVKPPTRLNTNPKATSLFDRHSPSAPAPGRQSLMTNQSTGKEKQISEMTNNTRRGGEEKKVLTNHILLMRQFLWCVYINCGFASKVTWSMANWVEILFEMGKIKSPGNLEGQHEQEGGAEVGGNRKRARSCERVWAVTMGKTWVPIKCKRHKGNLQMQGWRGRGGKNAFVISGFTVDLDPISQIGPAESFYVWWRWWSK